MQPKSDAQLLREYAETGSESAFAEIVGRHTDLVYSAALRQVPSPDLARDVAQNVFTGLARGARTLAGRLNSDASLAGWLCRCTRNLALNLRRDDFRRQTRESQAMNDLFTTPEAAPDWGRLRPLLDEAMSELTEPDHDALVLRYFKNHDLRTVGLALGISDDAAQKRVSRAVERLREFFAKRGVSVGAGGLIAVISASAVQAAPVGLAAAISTAAVLAGTATTTTLAAQAAALTMNSINLKSLTAIVAAAVAAGTGTYLVQHRETSRLQQENQSLAAQQAKLTEELDAAQTDAAATSNQLAAVQGERQELLRLRGEVGSLRRQKQELDDLRRRNDELQKSLAQAAPTEAEDDAPETLAARERMNDARQLGLALIMFSADHEDRFPSDIGQLSLYLPSTPGAEMMTNRFELVIHGPIKGVTNFMETITVRQKEPAIRNGQRVKAYGFADGHAEIRTEPPEGFAAWEKAHMIPLPSGP